MRLIQSRLFCSSIIHEDCSVPQGSRSSGPTLLCLIHRGRSRSAEAARRTVPYIRRQHSVPRQLPTWQHRHAALSLFALRRRQQLVVQVSSSPAKCQQDRGHLGWISIWSGEDSQLRLLSPSRLVQDSAVCRRPRFRPSLRQWTVYEAPCGQSGRYLPLPYSTPPPDSTTCRPGGHDSAGARSGDC